MKNGVVAVDVVGVVCVAVVGCFAVVCFCERVEWDSYGCEVIVYCGSACFYP